MVTDVVVQAQVLWAALYRRQDASEGERVLADDLHDLWPPDLINKTQSETIATGSKLPLLRKPGDREWETGHSQQERDRSQ